MKRSPIFDYPTFLACRDAFLSDENIAPPPEKDEEEAKPSSQETIFKKTFSAFCSPFLSEEQKAFVSFAIPLFQAMGKWKTIYGMSLAHTEEHLESCLFYLLAVNEKEIPDFRELLGLLLNPEEITIFKTLYLRKVILRDSVFNYEAFIDNRMMACGECWLEKERKRLGFLKEAGFGPYNQQGPSSYSSDLHEEYEEMWR
jgi:hypothetical protein